MRSMQGKPGAASFVFQCISVVLRRKAWQALQTVLPRLKPSSGHSSLSTCSEGKRAGRPIEVFCTASPCLLFFRYLSFVSVANSFARQTEYRLHPNSAAAVPLLQLLRSRVTLDAPLPVSEGGVKHTAPTLVNWVQMPYKKMYCICSF